jgi:hypothetical protein
MRERSTNRRRTCERHPWDSVQMELDGAGREIGMYGWRLLLGKKGKEGEPGLLLQGPSCCVWLQ